MTDASVNLWGRRIGAVSWDEERTVGVFQFEPAFLSAGVEVSPIVMPVREAPYAFAALRRETFMGLPGLLADALPDRFGNRLIDVWLAETGRSAREFNPVDRLCYMGTRATGALEFEPAIRHGYRGSRVEIAQLVDLADRILDERLQLNGRLGGRDDGKALENILSVGTSAGGGESQGRAGMGSEDGRVSIRSARRAGRIRALGYSSSMECRTAGTRGWPIPGDSGGSSMRTPSWLSKRASRCPTVGSTTKAAAATS